MIKLKKIKTLKGLKPNVVYETTNYKLFKKLYFNRAGNCGILQNKVESYKNKMIIGGDFMRNLQHTSVNMDSVIFDGTHRFIACKELNLPVRFMLYDADEVNNKTDLEMVEVLIKFNNVNSQWTPKQIFKTALGQNIAIAIEMDLIINKTVQSVGSLTKSNFTPSKLIGILKNNTKYLHGHKLTWNDLKDEILIEKIKSDKFKNDLSFMVAIMDLVSKDKKCEAEPRNVIERLFKAIWNEDVSKINVYTYIYRYGFNSRKEASSIKDRINDICTKRINKKLNWI